MVWHIGNTTVRSPYRLAGALQTLAASPLNGALSGKDTENAFARLLGGAGIVNVARHDDADVSDLGRKWRSAMSQLGFITPALTRQTPSGSRDPRLAFVSTIPGGLTGRQYEISANGLRLSTATTVAALQDCFLRSLAAYRIPSILEPRHAEPSFSPLRHCLRILLELRQRDEKPAFSFVEFALFIQTSTASEGIGAICDRLLEYRRGRAATAEPVRAFDRPYYERIAREHGVQEETLDDYADLSMRYLKATGVFQSSGRGICISSTRVRVAELLASQPDDRQSDEQYLGTLLSGSALPTDDLTMSLEVVYDLVAQLAARGLVRPTPVTVSSQTEVDDFREELEAELRHLAEEEYAAAQPGQIDEIAGWLAALASGRPVTLATGESLKVPRGEGPAYLEWSLWRAFLAIDSLINKPWEARRFQVDQDFRPVGCAPGGGPDAIFEYADKVIVLEATLSTSSRQEAMEGEPVRRHVAKQAEHFNGRKTVYGLFIANKVDSNTAHTFRLGDWYMPDDTKIYVDIVPMRIEDFQSLLVAGAYDLPALRVKLIELLARCRQVATRDAPTWKGLIASYVTESVNAMSVAD